MHKQHFFHRLPEPLSLPANPTSSITTQQAKLTSAPSTMLSLCGRPQLLPGYVGIQQQECQDRGCCWAPITKPKAKPSQGKPWHHRSTEPWCFHPEATGAGTYTVTDTQTAGEHPHLHTSRHSAANESLPLHGLLWFQPYNLSGWHRQSQGHFGINAPGTCRVLCFEAVQSPLGTCEHSSFCMFTSV
jgi:hypothetical protein